MNPKKTKPKRPRGATGPKTPAALRRISPGPGRPSKLTPKQFTKGRKAQNPSKQEDLRRSGI